MSTIKFVDPKDLVGEYEAIADGLDINLSGLYRDALEYYINSLPDICTIDDINSIKVDSFRKKLSKHKGFEIYGCDFSYDEVKVSFGEVEESENLACIEDKSMFKMIFNDTGESKEDIVSVEGYSEDKLCFRASIPLEDVPNVKFK